MTQSWAEFVWVGIKTVHCGVANYGVVRTATVHTILVPEEERGREEDELPLIQPPLHFHAVEPLIEAAWWHFQGPSVFFISALNFMLFLISIL